MLDLKDTKVAVIVPVYNVEGTLEATVKSIQAQSHKNLEIILVDDGSPDKSGELCDRLALEDPRIIVVHQKNGGVSMARNSGINAASSDYICFVDSDDEITFDFVENALQVMCDNDAQLAVLGVLYYYNNKTEYICKPNSVQEYTAGALKEYRQVLSDWFVTLTVSKMFSRKVITEKNIYFTPGITCAEDALFVMNYLYHCNKVVFSDKPGYRYFCYRCNASKRHFSFLSQKNYFESRKKYVEKYYPEETGKYCADKALVALQSRFEYLAKKQKKDFNEMNDALDYFLPYITPFTDNKEIFSEENWKWFENNKHHILNKNANVLYRKAVKQRKQQKHSENLIEFKKMSLMKKIKFLIHKVIG